MLICPLRTPPNATQIKSRKTPVNQVPGSRGHYLDVGRYSGLLSTSAIVMTVHNVAHGYEKENKDNNQCMHIRTARERLDANNRTRLTTRFWPDYYKFVNSYTVPHHSLTVWKAKLKDDCLERRNRHKWQGIATVDLDGMKKKRAVAEALRLKAVKRT